MKSSKAAADHLQIRTFTRLSQDLQGGNVNNRASNVNAACKLAGSIQDALVNATVRSVPPRHACRAMLGKMARSARGAVAFGTRSFVCLFV